MDAATALKAAVARAQATRPVTRTGEAPTFANFEATTAVERQALALLTNMVEVARAPVDKADITPTLEAAHRGFRDATRSLLQIDRLNELLIFLADDHKNTAPT